MIDHLHAGGRSIRQIAHEIGRSAATISRELRRNAKPTKSWSGGYDATRANSLRLNAGYGWAIDVSNWCASQTCKLASMITLRWDNHLNKSLADWRWNMVTRLSVMSQYIASSIIAAPRKNIGIVCCRAVNIAADAMPCRVARQPTSSGIAALSMTGLPVLLIDNRPGTGKQT
ncbi:helix-turn-helix domain-containing protein [Parasphingorhabdus sp. SCSIO 66989]|uniref:Helix-turn-helix domain-containing protein n=1 Tax=Alterisphingorhabdus coralli TaxID=3071408 RepID=A0AA97F8A0_9SPHN|nr:helix-turn-helix domain-containing protein [Parasphingorhabdus sp. SCSIO 66989]WOE76179.1 helix-turn-helix domain-containing protein [Parasphingorhabdus sp. SCSIO 66989]